MVQPATTLFSSLSIIYTPPHFLITKFLFYVLRIFFFKTPLNCRLPKMGGFDALMDCRIALDQETGESRFWQPSPVWVGVCMWEAVCYIP